LPGVSSAEVRAGPGCGSKGERSSTINGADPSKWDAVNSAVLRNYTWHVLRGSKFFNAGGSFDRDLAEYVMTMVGTIIYVPPTDSDPGRFQPLTGDTTSTLVTALLDGTSVGEVQVYHCDTEDQCLNPTLAPLSVPTAKALRPRVTALIDGMVEAIRSDTAISPAQKELLQISSIPLYKILTVQAAYARGLSTDDRSTGRDRLDRPGLPWKNWSNSEESPLGRKDWRMAWDVSGLRRSRSSRSCVRWMCSSAGVQRRSRLAGRSASRSRRCTAGARNMAA
jgi:hypothetical protein